MPLSKTQLQVIKTIVNRLHRGDIQKIAELTNVSREKVGRALNMTASFYDEPVVATAVKVIREREKQAEQHLQALTA